MSQAQNPTESQTAKDDLFADTNISQKSGRLTKDVELIGEDKYAKFRIATNKEFLDTKGDVQNVTNYFNIIVSSNLSDAFGIAKNLKKGDWVYIKGEDNSRSIDTVEGYKDTGVTTFAYKVVLKKPKPNQEANSNQLEIDDGINGASLDQQ